MAIDFPFYRDEYRGELSVTEFASVLFNASSFVDNLCDRRAESVANVSGFETDIYQYKRAVCAVCDIFAIYGQADMGAVSLGDFKVSGYGSTSSVEQLALSVAMRELSGTTLLFSGVR